MYAINISKPFLLSQLRQVLIVLLLNMRVNHFYTSATVTSFSTNRDLTYKVLLCSLVEKSRHSSQEIVAALSQAKNGSVLQFSRAKHECGFSRAVIDKYWHGGWFLHKLLDMYTTSLYPGIEINYGLYVKIHCRFKRYERLFSLF